VGTAVKDLPEGAETDMKKSVALTASRVQQKFDADLHQYEEDIEVASTRAKQALDRIDGERTGKAIAVTLLVVSILATIGAIVAAAATGILPLLFVAVPLIAVIAASSYYVHHFNTEIAQLKRDIASPSLLTKPVLNLPSYDSAKDLDLEKSRTNAQNTIATMSLEAVAQSNWSTEQLRDYALLDRVTQLDEDSRPAFYAKCIELIHSYNKIAAERLNYLNSAESEHNRLWSELHRWKQDQEAYIRSQEMQVSYTYRAGLSVHRTHHPYSRHRHLVTRPTVRIVPTYTFRPNWEINRMREAADSQFAHRSSEIANWHQNTVHAIESGFNQTTQTLDHKFRELRAFS